MVWRARTREFDVGGSRSLDAQRLRQLGSSSSSSSSIKDFSHEFVRESFTQRGAVMMLNYKIIYTLLLYMYRVFTKLHICAYGKGKKNAVRYIANLDQSSHVVLKFSLTKMWRMRIWGEEYMYAIILESFCHKHICSERNAAETLTSFCELTYAYGTCIYNGIVKKHKMVMECFLFDRLFENWCMYLCIFLYMF